MEVICSCETSVDFQLTTRRYIPKDNSLHLKDVCGFGTTEIRRRMINISKLILVISNRSRVLKPLLEADDYVISANGTKCCVEIPLHSAV
jgi:hypothetical protein